MNETHDLRQIEKQILSLELKADNKVLSLDELKKHQEALNKYKEAGSLKRGAYMLGELQGLILLAQGNEQLANDELVRAKSLMKPGESWVSDTAQKWDRMNEVEPQDTPQNTFGSNRAFQYFAVCLVLGIISLLLDLIINLPKFNFFLSDYPNGAGVVGEALASLKTGLIFYDVVAILLLGIIGYLLITRNRLTRWASIITMVFLIIGYAWITSDFESAVQQVAGDFQYNQAPWVVIGAFIWLPYWIFARSARKFPEQP